MATPPRYREAEREIFAPATRDRLMATTEQVLAELQETTQLLSNASKGVPVALIAVPISYHLDSYDGDHATVSLWWVWVVGQQGAMAPIQAWVSSVVTLDWLGDWRVESVDSASTPVPALTQTATESKDLPEQMHGFREYGHASR